jgi:hypothetical protein
MPNATKNKSCNPSAFKKIRRVNQRFPRTRSYEKELEQEALAKADSHIDSQALRDPILARLVMAWPSLSEERKKIISSLLSVP